MIFLYTKSVLLSPTKLFEDWRPQSFSELTAEDFAGIVALKPDLVLLGTGKTQQFPSPVLYQALTAMNIGVEVMDTGAACRVFNILLSEGRIVVAALIIH